MTETAHQPALFDAAHLARYTLGDTELERDVLTMFFEQAALLHARLADAHSNEAWRDAAHSLKGSARGIGAFRLGIAAETAEKLPQAVKADRAPLLQTLADEMTALQHAVHLHLERSTPARVHAQS